jgi:SSS family solute:Na+ symporter
MAVKIGVFAVYFLVVLFIGFLARSRWKSTPEAYFLADRKLGTLVLLGTMAATNFSAFTVFGTSGAGYRDGYAFFPIMGFGTGFMALTFWIIGRRVWRIGRERGLVTPPELIRSLYGSPSLSLSFALVMIVFTVPYLALQPMAAGYALEELIGLPYGYGCILVTGIIVLYTLRGGMRAVAWTDLFQGTLMLVMLMVSLVIVVNHHGGLLAANRKMMALSPALFSRPGGLGTYTPGIWFSYLMLWFFCDPMFPQLFQRFFSARSSRTLSRIMLFYPLVCTVVFIMVMNLVSGDVMATLVIAAGLAALMSTMDSQLLTLSSIFTRDVLPTLGWKEPAAGSLAGRIFVVGLSLAGLLLAYNPPATILQIATQTFTGLAVLFPTVLFGLYFRRVFAPAAMASILCGEMLLLIFYFKWVSAGAFLPVVWVMAAAFAVYLLVHAVLAGGQARERWRRPGWLRSPYLYLLGGIFVLGIDVWAWGRAEPLVMGLPAWLWYFVGLSILQTGITVFLIRSEAGSKGTGRLW